MTTWHTGQAWRTARGLDVLRDQIRAWAPMSVPPATDPNAWGSIADNVHATSSDHYPHWLWDADQAIVCARDFPHAPGLGLDSYVLAEHLRQVRDPRVQYVISNHRITGVSYGWTWHTYTGDDPHDTHIHVSVKRSSVSDGTQAWSLPGGVSAAAPVQKAKDPMIFTVKETAGFTATDCVGEPVVNASRVMATPAGPFVLEYDEMIDWYNANGKETSMLPMSWARINKYCGTLKQDPSTISVEVTEDVIASTLESDRGQAAIQSAVRFEESH